MGAIAIGSAVIVCFVDLHKKAAAAAAPAAAIIRRLLRMGAWEATGA
jgi:hypothetical protein